MTLRAYLRIFRERWKVIVGCLLGGTVLAVLITAFTPDVYQASVQVYVASNGTADPAAQYGGVIAAQSQAATFADVVRSADILHRVESDLNLRISDQALAAKLSATAPTQRSLVTIYATDASPTTAATIANSTANAFVVVIEKFTTPTKSDTPAVKLSVTAPAVAPSSPISPRPVLNIALGFVLGLLVGVALAVARDVLDRRVKDSEGLEKVIGLPTMGEIVEDPHTARYPVATSTGGHSRRAENFRQLRANLQFANVDQHPRIIALTSSVPGEGKTIAAINLASILAEAGYTVCLVDADLRRPAVGRLLGLPAAVGLTNVLINQISVAEAVQSAGALHVLTSGPVPPNPSEVLASSYVREVVRSLLVHYDYVVLDTAPLLPVADGSEVAALADGSLLVVRHNKTTDTQVRRAVQTLARVDAKILGTVLNRIPERQTTAGYSYTSFDDTGSAEVADRSSKPRPARESVS